MTTTATSATVVELAAQIRLFSAQLLAEVMREEADVDFALVIGHLAQASAQQADIADLIADRAGNTDGGDWATVNTDAHSAAYFLGVAAARFTAAQAAAAVGQEVLARAVRVATPRSALQVEAGWADVQRTA